MIRTDPSGPITDWLDACCWSCGTDEVTVRADGRLLCGPCRRDLFSEPAADPLHLSRHAYWESHALGCCWRCMLGAVEPHDEVGLCRSCLVEIATA